MSNQDSDDTDIGVRRSSRSNKGKHSKRAISYITKAITEQEDEGGDVKCVCGAKTVEDGDDRSMCECEKCLTWQHVQCMLGKDDPDIVPDGYLCNDCSGGDKSIDSSVKQHEQQQDDEKTKIGSNPVDTSRTKPNAPKKQPEVPDVVRIADLKDKVRQSVAIALKKIFVSTALPEAIESKKFSLPQDVTADDFAEKLSLEIEQALYEEHAVKPIKSKKKQPPIDVGHKYRDKFRSLSFNLRDEKNPGLRLRIITGELTPKHIAELTSEEMLNPELQKLAESVRKESIRESVLKVEDGPRIRKTHKGDEIIEMQKDAEYHEIKPNAELAEEAESKDRKHSSDVEEDAESRKRHKSTTSEEETHRKSVDYDQSTFYEDVATFSPVGSPHQSGDEGTGLLTDDEDAELNDLLDNDEEEKPESKPQEPAQEIGIWIGNVSMAGIAQFPASALHLQGTENFNPYDSWSEIMDLSAPMVIDGRLDEAKAGTYLYAIRNTKAIVSAILKSDESDASRPAFNKIFDYYHSRKKIGIIKNRKSNVKDSYLIALSSKDPVPAYLALDQKAEETITKLQGEGNNLLIVLFVTSPFVGKQRSEVSESIRKSPKLGNNEPYSSYSANTNTTSMNSMNVGGYNQSLRGAAPMNIPISGTLPIPTATRSGQFGLSTKDFDLLKGVLAQNPEVASNPQLPNNPQLLLDLLQKTQGGGR